MHDRLDISSEPDLGAKQPEPTSPTSRPFLGVKFECCGIYSRIYQNKKGTHYVGNCPKCAKQIRVKIGHGGSSNRFFTAY